MAKKITQAEIIVTRLFPSGAYECAAIVDGYWVRRRYFGYTKREAVRLFWAEVNGVDD